MFIHSSEWNENTKEQLTSSISMDKQASQPNIAHLMDNHILYDNKTKLASSADSNDESDSGYETDTFSSSEYKASDCSDQLVSEHASNRHTLKITDDLSPRKIVKELDRYIIGQAAAKRAIALAVCNRRRRMKLPKWLKLEVTPKNILLIGPSGVGKTELARRVARITDCPFLKVEATKFTEVGYIGRDVDSIPRDLVDNAFKKLRQKELEKLTSQVQEAVEERILDCFVYTDKDISKYATSGLKSSEKDVARNVYRKRFREGLLDDEEIEIELNSSSVGVEIMGPPGMEEMTNQLQNMVQSFSSGRTRKHRIKVKEAIKLVEQEEADQLLKEEDLKRRAVEWVEEYGIVFIDEIDKVCRRGDISGSDVSREGVQRDLLPLIEGSTVSTKYGMVRTDRILFITAGAFHSGQKPSDLIPELQGRLPVRVELDLLTAKDFERILRECHASLLTQYKALLETEGVILEFEDKAITRIAEIAYLLNEKVENIGARRLYTVMERLLEEVSFEASELTNKHVVIDVDYVNQQLASLSEDEDSSHYIL
jgi:ATP-dependent HslUV protease ATP-binding subunit HslU